MIISIALGIVLAVVILRLLPLIAYVAVLSGMVAYAVVRGLLKLSVQIVRAILGHILAELRAARYSRSVQFALFLSALIIALFALVK